MSRPRPEQLLRGRVDAFVTATTLPDRLDTFVALVRWTRPAAGDNGTLDELLNLLDDPHRALPRSSALRPAMRRRRSTRSMEATARRQMLTHTEPHAVNARFDCDRNVIRQPQNLDEHRGLRTHTE